MSTSFTTKFLNSLPLHSKVIILPQIDDDQPQVFTLKRLRWDEITMPKVIELEEA